MRKSVSVIVGKDRLQVPPVSANSPPLVPATSLLIEIESDRVPATILVDDEDKPVVLSHDKSRGYLLLDFYRSTGFHRFELEGETYCIGTADAKLQLDGILRILNQMPREALSWSGQIIFADGAVISDPRVDLAWIRSIRRKVFSLCDAIAEKPATRFRAQQRSRLPMGGKVLIPETLAYLRSNIGSMLEEHERGLLKVGSRRWMPRRVIAQTEVDSFDTVGNRRATRLLHDLSCLCQSLMDSGEVPNRQARWLAGYQSRLRDYLDRFPFRLLLRSIDRLPPSRSREEICDVRYSAVYEIEREMALRRGWSPGRRLSDRYAYVGYADEIYQAYVCVLLARAFCTNATQTHLRSGLPSPSFSSDSWFIYYDTQPPRPEYSSWRDTSSRPADLTPDYCIIDRVHRRGILGDAKYRSDGGSTLPGASLRECQSYMQHFDTANFVVFFPGSERYVEAVSGEGKTILIVSIVPFDGIEAWVQEEVCPRIESLLCPLGH